MTGEPDPQAIVAQSGLSLGPDDDTVILWMLSLTPTERLHALQSFWNNVPAHDTAQNPRSFLDYLKELRKDV